MRLWKLNHGRKIFLTEIINMSREDREYLIGILTELSNNKTESYFTNLTDAELENEYDRLTNERYKH